MLPDDRTTWQALAGERVARARAQAVDALLAGARRVASYGVGTAVTERALHMLDLSRRLVLTEYAPRTASRLVELFPEATVVRHDLHHESPIEGIDVHLFLRIDTEFDDAALRGVLTRFNGERIVLAATELLGVRALLRETVTWLRGGAVAAGQVRSRGAFEALFADTHASHVVRIHDLDGWLLEPRR